MDRQSVYSTHVFEPSFGDNGDSRLQLRKQLETFILDFRLDNNFVYRYACKTHAAASDVGRQNADPAAETSLGRTRC